MSIDLSPFTALSPRGRALLNKIFRATHDGVCANCGGDLIKRDEPIKRDGYVCPRCHFVVTAAEMQAMEAIVVDWGKEAVAFFSEWRTQIAADQQAEARAFDQACDRRAETPCELTDAEVQEMF